MWFVALAGVWGKDVVSAATKSWVRILATI